MELEIYVIVALAIFFAGAYAVGSRWNYRIQKKVWSTLSKELKPFCKSVRFQGFGSSGFRIGCQPSKGTISKLEITVKLMAREIPLYYIYSKFKGRRDEVIIRSNFRKPPKFSVEVMSRGRLPKEKIPQRLLELEEVKLSGLTEKFWVKASRVHPAIELLSREAIISNFKQLSEYIERLSIVDEEPHLMVVCAMDKEIIRPLIKLVTQIGGRIEAIAK